MTSFTSPSPLWDFYFDISEWHILRARVWTPMLMLHLSNPCAMRKVLSLTKPKGKIYKKISLGHYITYFLYDFPCGKVEINCRVLSYSEKSYGNIWIHCQISNINKPRKNIQFYKMSTNHQSRLGKCCIAKKLFNVKVIIMEEQYGYYLTHSSALTVTQ